MSEIENKPKIDVMQCKRCGGLMIKELTDYTKQYLTTTIIVHDVEGYSCAKCGNKFISDKVMAYVSKKIIAEELKYKASQERSYILINKVRQVRMSKGLSQKELGEMLGSSEQRYGAIERNFNIPLNYTEHLLATLLNVKIEQLYEMVAISTKFYNKLINLELKSGGKKGYQFEYVEQVAKLREELKEKRLELEKCNIEKRTYKFMLKSGETTEEQANKRIKELDKKIENIKKIKDGKNGLETRFKKLIRKHNIILKQERIIDAEDWEKVCTIFGKEIFAEEN